jgi:hypothetical protein
VNRMTTLLSSAVLASVAATGASSQTADVGRVLVASNILKLSADTARSGTFQTAIKQFIVPYSGVVKVSWQLKSDGTHTATASINSRIQTCNSTTTAATFQTASCNLRVVAGDGVQVWAQGQIIDFTTFTYSPTSIRQVRLFYNVVNSTGVGLVVSD